MNLPAANGRGIQKIIINYREDVAKRLNLLFEDWT